MRTILTACVLALAAMAHGQPDGSTPLSGPKVQEDHRALTIIERHFDGSVKLPEGTAEEAALAQLGLDAMDATPEARAALERVRTILAERGRILEDFVFENVELLTKFDTAGNTGDKADQLRLIAEGYRRLAPLREKGPLSDQIRAVLPAEKAGAFDTILRSYWEAVIADRVSRPKPDGKYPNRLEAIAGARLEVLGKEIERSFYRLYMSGEFVYRIATRDIKLRPEQSRRLREIIDEHYQVTKGNDDEQANKRLLARSFAVLDEEQRPRFLRNLMSLGKPKKAGHSRAAAPSPAADDPAGTPSAK